MQNGFAQVRNGFTHVRNGFAHVRNGFGHVQNGFAHLRNGFAHLRNGVAHVRNGFAQAQADRNLSKINEKDRPRRVASNLAPSASPRLRVNQRAQDLAPFCPERQRAGATRHRQPAPCIDNCALQDPGQTETREFRVRYRDKGVPNGNFTPTIKVTVGA